MVPPSPASAVAWCGSSGTWPETTVKAWLTPRWVTGMPALPGTPTADETPGTTVTGSPASTAAATSSPPRPKT